MVQDFNAYSEEGINSKFNAGMLQMQRIHKLQDEMNNLNKNLIAVDIETGLRNYEVLVNCINSLFQEVSPKLSDKEKVEGLKTKELVECFLEKRPIHSDRTATINSHKKYVQFNKDNFKQGKKIIFMWEFMVRNYLEKHKMNSPPDDESALF